MPRRILIVTGDAGESYEALYAVHRFQESGDDPVVAAPVRRRLHLVIHDFEPGWATYVERAGYGLEASITLDEARVGDFDAILILGGRAPEYLRHNAQLVALVRAFEEAGKWVFAICHGIQVLAAANLVRNRDVTCYEHCRWEAEQAGARWQSPQAVRDGRMITAQTWQSHPDFYRLIYRAFSEE
jgi:protease I